MVAAYDAYLFCRNFKMDGNEFLHPPVREILLSFFFYRNCKVGVRHFFKHFFFGSGDNAHFDVHIARIAFLLHDEATWRRISSILPAKK